jgi:hypothetical protein
MPSKVMFNDLEREMLQPYNAFTQMLYVLGIKFKADYWGVLTTNVYDISLHINPDTILDETQVAKSLEDLETTGLIKYIGRNNSIMVVQDFGKVNYFNKMKMNKNKHNKQSEYVIPIKQAIKSGELEPYFLEIPAVDFHRKDAFIKHYENGTLSQLTYKKDNRTYNFQDSLMYMDLYFEYQERKKKESEVGSGQPF